ncbi:putative 12-oxophytodienoate reductase [Phaeomoniella chlamydospora]|uniref:Putative 12-oxophytodienoate reductase n=1 Tax=Phaeomoniella chlamydospora TaxID=158046 RepID=A0A0G2G120_PHACM|nr:putative 12-oxophytodienoate reductase [Phaeomoniella chlamydospora]
MGSAPEGAESAIFTPLKIGNGKITLKHRVVLAPLTRNRGTPLNGSTIPTKYSENIWVHDDLGVEYYSQRATEGGLIISEGIPPSLESNGFPGGKAYGIQQVKSWKKVVDAVHAKGGVIYAQLWFAGRATIDEMTGSRPLSSSPTAWDTDEYYAGPSWETGEKIMYKDRPPIGLTKDQIKEQIGVCAHFAKLAMEAGFDGVEAHGGNGYIIEQFLSSNINKRTDEYGGSVEGYTRFPIELMTAMADAIGQENLAIRLSPFGLYNRARGEKRVEIWGHLCRELKRLLPNLSYVHFLEPRYEQIHSYEEKQKFLDAWGLSDVDLSMFRHIFHGTPFLTAGGWNDTNVWGQIEAGKYDAFAIGRYFISNPDLPRRLKEKLPLQAYDRSKFYFQPYDQRPLGYVDYPFWKE